MSEGSSEGQPRSTRISRILTAAGKAARFVYKGLEVGEQLPIEKIDKRVVAQQILRITDNKIAPSDITYHLGHDDSLGGKHQKATARVRAVLQEMVSDGWLERVDHEQNERGDTATYPILDREAIEKLAKEPVPAESTRSS